MNLFPREENMRAIVGKIDPLLDYKTKEPVFNNAAAPMFRAQTCIFSADGMLVSGIKIPGPIPESVIGKPCKIVGLKINLYDRDGLRASLSADAIEVVTRPTA